MFRRHFLQSLFGTLPTALVIGDVTVGGERISPSPASVTGAGTDVVNVKDFGAVGDGSTNDTAAIRSAIGAVARSVAALQASAGSIHGSYLGSVGPLYFPAGRYRIDDELVFPPYARVLAFGSVVLHQENPDRRVLVFPDGYDVVVEGLKLVGGTHQVDFRNQNADGATLRLVGCEFQLACGFAIHTLSSIPSDPHLSCNLSVVRCKFIMPRQVLHNVCDSARVEDCSVSVGRTNFAPDTAAFVNLRGDLYLQNMFGVPTVGTGETRTGPIKVG